MPANLTPQYYEAEERYKAATSPEEKMTALKEMLSTIPKHKGTEKLQGDIKKRIAALKKDSEKKKSKNTFNPFHVEKQGAGQVVLVGFPNVGKSSLVAALTRAKTKVADYPFSTSLPVAGMMPYEDILIQLVDTPPITAEGIPGTLMATLQTAHCFLVVVDAADDLCVDHLTQVTDFLTQRRLVREEVPEGVRALTPDRVLYVATKVLHEKAEENLSIVGELWEGPRVLEVSTEGEKNLDVLKEEIFRVLKVNRIYTKAPGKEPDFTAPFILPKGSTVMELAESIHHEVAENLKGARVWGSARFDGQSVQRDYCLEDKDVVELKA